MRVLGSALVTLALLLASGCLSGTPNVLTHEHRRAEVARARVLLAPIGPLVVAVRAEVRTGYGGSAKYLSVHLRFSEGEPPGVALSVEEVALTYGEQRIARSRVEYEGGASPTRAQGAWLRFDVPSVDAVRQGHPRLEVAARIGGAPASACIDLAPALED